MCSLTAVYINQYIYQTAAAYCVCRFEWAKDTKDVSMLRKKGHPAPVLPVGPCHPFRSFSIPPFLPLSLPAPLAKPLLVLQSHTDIQTALSAPC